MAGVPHKASFPSQAHGAGLERGEGMEQGRAHAPVWLCWLEVTYRMWMWIKERFLPRHGACLSR